MTRLRERQPLAPLGVLAATLIAALALSAALAGSAAAKTTSEAASGIRVKDATPAKGCGGASARPSDLVCSKSQGAIATRKAKSSCFLGQVGCAIGNVPGGVIDGVGDAIGGAVGDVASGASDSIMNGMAGWVASGVGALMDKTFKYMNKSTTPQVAESWFTERYGAMMRLAGLLSVLGIVGAAIVGLAEKRVGGAMQAVLLYLPIAFIVVGGLTSIAQLGLLATDQLTEAFIGSFGQDTKEMTESVLKFMVPEKGAQDGDEVAAGAFVMLVMAVLALLGTLMLFIELLIRESVVYIVLLYAPIGIIASVWPPAKRIGRKMGILLFVAIVSKFFILTTFAFGATMINEMGKLDDTTGLLGGIVVMCMAAFSPMALLKLLPFDEIDAISGRPPTPVGAQITASQMGRQAITSRLGSKKDDDDEKDKGSSSSGTGKGPGGKSPVSPGGGPSGSPKGSPAGGSPGGSAGGSTGGSAGGAAAGGAAAGAATGGVMLAAAAHQGGKATAAKAAGTVNALTDGPGGKQGQTQANSSPGKSKAAGSQGKNTAAHVAAKQQLSQRKVKSV